MIDDSLSDDDKRVALVEMADQIAVCATSDPTMPMYTPLTPLIRDIEDASLMRHSIGFSRDDVTGKVTDVTFNTNRLSYAKVKLDDYAYGFEGLTTGDLDTFRSLTDDMCLTVDHHHVSDFVDAVEELTASEELGLEF